MTTADSKMGPCLGRIHVPQLLRAAGLRLVTLAEHYGIPADEDVHDITWLEDAGTNGCVVFMKDAKIRRRPAEQQVLVQHRVRAFCLVRGNLSAAETAGRFIANLDAIAAVCGEAGPFVYVVMPTASSGSPSDQRLLLPVQHLRTDGTAFTPR